jgi:hypothetical protein
MSITKSYDGEISLAKLSQLEDIYKLWGANRATLGLDAEGCIYRQYQKEVGYCSC